MEFTTFMTLTKKVNEAYKRRREKITEQFNISGVDFDIIMFLLNNPEYYTAKDISEMRRIKPNVLSIHIEKLVSCGYLVREKVPGDRRKIKLVYTEKAEPVIKMGRQMQKDFFKDLLEGLSHEDIDKFRYYIGMLEKNADKMIEV